MKKSILAIFSALAITVVLTGCSARTDFGYDVPNTGYGAPNDGTYGSNYSGYGSAYGYGYDNYRGNVSTTDGGRVNGTNRTLTDNRTTNGAGSTTNGAGSGANGAGSGATGTAGTGGTGTNGATSMS